MTKEGEPKTATQDTEASDVAHDTAEHSGEAAHVTGVADAATHDTGHEPEKEAHGDTAEHPHNDDREPPTSIANARVSLSKMLAYGAVVCLILLALVAVGFYYSNNSKPVSDASGEPQPAPAAPATQQTQPQTAPQQTPATPVQPAPAFQQQNAQASPTTIQEAPAPQLVMPQQAVQPQAAPPATPTPAPAIAASQTVATAPVIVPTETTEERIKLKYQREENELLRQQLKDMQDANRQRDQNDFVEKMLSQQRQHDAERQREQDARLERALDRQRQNELANRQESRNKVDALYAEVIRLQQRPIVVQVNMSSPAVRYQEQPQFQQRNVQMQICP